MKFRYALLTAIFPFYLFGQEIYPIPKQLINQNQKIRFEGVKSKQIQFFDFQSNKGLKIKYKKNHLILQEGYKLIISPKTIQIEYSSERGKFYAEKTLYQLLEQAKVEKQIPLVTISDQPDIKYRGVVEGFYGQPWSHEDRISQLKFYGDNKLNTYIYGPKDDPYHSSPNWRENYPTDEANKLKELVDFATENHVDFYWAIHPGKDIKWNNQDRDAVLHKFEKMYQLGIRHFAVFFDDISGIGTDANRQAELLNYLQKEFVDKKDDIGALIMCPTEYNKGWSNPKEGTYLDILGDKLDPKIHIMWTGNTVIHDITNEGQKWVNQRIKRPSFVWWNFPVNDYVRNHLLLGSAYGLDKNNKDEMSGFVSNPMDKPEASKVAIFSVANYSWNLKAYDDKESWNVAINRLFPEIKDEYKIFSSHNADPGPSYHQYRREESANIKSILENKLIELDKENVSPFSFQDYTQLKTEFLKFYPVSNQILKNAKNQNLLKEIKPWVQFFGVEGEAALKLLDVYQAESLDKMYQEFLAFQILKNKMIEIDSKENRGHSQPGIVTASRYVLPWIEKSTILIQQKLKSAGYKIQESLNQPKGKVFTTIEQLQTLPIVNDVETGNRPLQVLRLTKTLEYIPMKPNDYIGIEITSTNTLKEFKFRAEDKIEELEIQYSQDGKNWLKQKTKETKYIRVLNTSNKTIYLKYNQFDLIFE